MNSLDKYHQKMEDQLDCIRNKYAGQKVVCCATSLDRAQGDWFDFTNVKREDINHSINGDNYIVAKAKNLHDEEVRICYLKYVNRFADVIKHSRTNINAFDFPKGRIPQKPDFLQLNHIDIVKTAEKVVLKSIFNEEAKKQTANNLSIEGSQLILKDEDEKETCRVDLSELNFETFVTNSCNNLRDMLIEKNKSYGNSALDPVRVFSTADSEEQIKVRIDDKLSRIKRGSNSFNEDTIRDLMGYLILLQYKKSLSNKDQ